MRRFHALRSEWPSVEQLLEKNKESRFLKIEVLSCEEFSASILPTIVALADDFRTFMLNRDIFEPVLSTA